MKNSTIVDKVSRFSIFLLLPIFGFCCLLLSKIRTLDFASPYINDWILTAVLVCLFYTFFTMAVLLIISLYYQFRSIVLENQGKPKSDIGESINSSKKMFVLTFEFLNLMLICTAIFCLFWILLYFICPFVYPFFTSKVKYWTASFAVTTFITLLMIILLSKTRLGNLFRCMYSDCTYLRKKFKHIWMLYLAILTLVFPLCCYRFELQINDELFTKSQDSLLIVNISLGGMTSISRRLKSYLISDEIEKEIPLDFKKIDKLRLMCSKKISNLPKGVYKVKSFYKRRLFLFVWYISREKVFHIT